MQCKAKAKSTGEQCKLPSEPGFEVCRFHGGKSPRGVDHPSFKTGLYSQYLPGSIQAKVETFLNADPFELLSELALLRALLAEYVGRFEHGKLTAHDVSLLADLAERVGKFSERINRMRNDTALTGAEMTYLAARCADIVVKYIDDPERQRDFVSDLIGAIRGANAGSPDSVPVRT